MNLCHNSMHSTLGHRGQTQSVPCSFLSIIKVLATTHSTGVFSVQAVYIEHVMRSSEITVLHYNILSIVKNDLKDIFF